MRYRRHGSPFWQPKGALRWFARGAISVADADSDDYSAPRLELLTSVLWRSGEVLVVQAGRLSWKGPTRVLELPEKFPAPGAERTIRAVNDGRYFTEIAGLVAMPPIAEALADEVPYFAWLHRREAFERFGFDPDGVFRKQPG